MDTKKSKFILSRLSGFWFVPWKDGAKELDIHEIADARYFETFAGLCAYLSKHNADVVQTEVIRDNWFVKAYACGWHGYDDYAREGMVFQEVDVDVWNAMRDKAMKEIQKQENNEQWKHSPEFGRYE